MKKLGLGWGIGVALGAGGVACDNAIPHPPPSVRSTTAVVLPAAPVLKERTWSKRTSDGSYTVEGLIREPKQALGEDIVVAGVVKEITLCPPPAEPPPPGERPPRTCSPPPHLLLVDANPVSKRQLLVYGTMWSALPTFKVGDALNLVGHFDIVSKDGVFLRQAGLLELPDLPPPEPPAPAPTEAPTP